MFKPVTIHLPRTQEELAACFELDRLGLAGHGDSQGPTLEQIAAYGEREKATQGKAVLLQDQWEIDSGIFADTASKQTEELIAKIIQRVREKLKENNE